MTAKITAIFTIELVFLKPVCVTFFAVQTAKITAIFTIELVFLKPVCVTFFAVQIKILAT